MTRIFDEQGGAVPVTVIDTKDCYVSQVRSPEKDGYAALQLSFGEMKPQNVPKAHAGHFRKANLKPQPFLREIRFSSAEEIAHLKAGQRLVCSMFAKGDWVDVMGTSKGKGFQGVMKRWGFHGADATHGVSAYFRHGGSNGTNTFPGKTLKNKGMPGHTGHVASTAQRVKIIDVKPDEDLLLVRGALPGPRNGVLMIRNAKKGAIPQGRNLVKGD